MLRSRSQPLGLATATANDYDRIQHSYNAVEVSWWFAAAALTAQPQPVQLILNLTEDFGGETESGPTSIWALEGFHLWEKLGEEQLSSAGSPELIIVGQWVYSPTSRTWLRFLFDGWPSHRMQQGKRQYHGPLQQNCPCASGHPPMTGVVDGGLNSGTAPLLTGLFWARLFSALSPVSGNVALLGWDCCIHHVLLVFEFSFAVGFILPGWLFPWN